MRIMIPIKLMVIEQLSLKMNHNLLNKNSFLFPDKKSKCIVNIDGRMLEKTVGEVWNSPNDLCLKHTCEIAPNGIAVESTFQEYCYHKCNNVSYFVLTIELSITSLTFRLGL